MADFIEIFLNEFLLLDKLDVSQRLRCKSDGLECIVNIENVEILEIIARLIETVFASVADINDFDDFCDQTPIEHITLTQFGFEVSTSGKDQARNVDLVVGNEMLHCVFGDLSNVVVSLFVSQTRETQRRLSSASVLFRQIDSKFVYNFTSVSSENTEEGAVTIHDDEAKAGVGFEKF